MKFSEYVDDIFLIKSTFLKSMIKLFRYIMMQKGGKKEILKYI